MHKRYAQCCADRVVATAHWHICLPHIPSLDKSKQKEPILTHNLSNRRMPKPMTIILIGAIIVVIGGITGAIGTYLHNKKSSAKTDKIISFQNELIEKSEKLIQAQNENKTKSDSIISLQNKLHEAN